MDAPEDCRILAKGVYQSNDTRLTGINNNDLVIGPSGAGKTRSYIKSNIMQAEHSIVVADVKGNLRRELESYLTNKGFQVLDLDFTDMLNSKCGYNPLDFVHYDADQKKYSEQDIMTVSAALIPTKGLHETFWEEIARLYFEALCGYVLECLPKEEHNLTSINTLAGYIGTPALAAMFRELGDFMPDCFAVRRFQQMQSIEAADRMQASIMGILYNRLNPMNFSGAASLFEHEKRVDFASLGREKTALFVTSSDTDRSMDTLVSLFFTQCLQVLCRSADTEYADCRLDIPVRLMLDDFATNCFIADFDKTSSIIRSREIYVSLALQSLTQLETMYGYAASRTIANNCDCWLYFPSQDIDTARAISIKLNKTIQTVLEMPTNSAALFVRGQKPRIVEKYDVRDHQDYLNLPEAKGERSSSDV